MIAADPSRRYRAFYVEGRFRDQHPPPEKRIAFPTAGSICDNRFRSNRQRLTASDATPPTRAVLLAAGFATGAATIAGCGRAQQRIVMNDAPAQPDAVMKHWQPKPIPRMRSSKLRAAPKEAASARQPVAVGAARHSMGGQSLPRDGVAITLDARSLSPTPRRTYRIDAGARWADVAERSIRSASRRPIMQQQRFRRRQHFLRQCARLAYAPRPLADGAVVRWCLRTPGGRLFKDPKRRTVRAAMGGYGLFGVIVDLELEMDRNILLAPTVERMPGNDFADRFVRRLNRPAGPDGLRAAVGCPQRVLR